MANAIKRHTNDERIDLLIDRNLNLEKISSYAQRNKWLVKGKNIRNYTSPQFEVARVINLLSKRGAEGQSPTDTGPPPVFESGASSSNQGD